MVAPAPTVQFPGVGVVTADNFNTYVQVALNYAQMRTFSGLANMAVYALGASSPDDGGGGSYYWNATSTATDNNSTVIVPYGNIIGAWIEITTSFSTEPIATLTNIASLRAVSASTFPEGVAFVEGYYTYTDGGEGMFEYVPNDTSSSDNGGTIIVDASGRRWYRALNGGPTNVRQFGAKGIGSSFNDTSAFQNAIATGLSVYIPPVANPNTQYYYLTNAVTCTTVAQLIYGAGKNSTIQIDGNFNLSATGVFVVSLTTPFIPAPTFKDFFINFVQPDTTNRSSLTSYPPAFYAQNMARGTYDGVKINAATVGIDIRQNAGGTSILNCELCAFSDHILIDGSLDTISIVNCRLEDDLLTANQRTIYASPGTVGISSGRCDDLIINGCLLLCGQQLSLFIGTGTNPGVTYGTITGTGFDTQSGIAMTAGQIQVSGCYFSSSSAGNTQIAQSGGELTVSSCRFSSSIALTDGMVIVSTPTSTSANLVMSDCIFDVTGNTTAVNTVSVSGGICDATISGCRFNTSGVVTNPTVQAATNSFLSMSGCRFSPIGAGSGPALSIIVDGPHNITGNTFNGWATELPAGHSQLVFASNN